VPDQPLLDLDKKLMLVATPSSSDVGVKAVLRFFTSEQAGEEGGVCHILFDPNFDPNDPYLLLIFSAHNAVSGE